MKISILTATYKRPDMLSQCLKKGKEKAGTKDYEWLIYDNEKEENIGLNAYAELVKRAKGEYLVTVDEDVIDFSQSWLIGLLNAYQDPPKTKHKWKTWGWLGCDTVKDDKTNGALWPDWMEETRRMNIGMHQYLIDKQIPQTCAMVSRKVYDKVGGFPTDDKKVFPIDARFGRKIEKFQFPQAVCLNIRVYHASGPYFYKKYPELWFEKQGEMIEQSAKIYLQRDPSLYAYQNFRRNA